jgi:hypothetical protein
VLVTGNGKGVYAWDIREAILEQAALEDLLPPIPQVNLTALQEKTR